VLLLQLLQPLLHKYHVLCLSGWVRLGWDGRMRALHLLPVLLQDGCVMLLVLLPQRVLLAMHPHLSGGSA